MIDKQPHVTRDVLASEAGDWLLLWSEQGWVAARGAERIGVDVHGEKVVRFVLVPDARSRRGSRRPSTPPAVEVVHPPEKVRQQPPTSAGAVATLLRTTTEATAVGL